MWTLGRGSATRAVRELGRFYQVQKLKLRERNRCQQVRRAAGSHRASAEVQGQSRSD